MMKKRIFHVGLIVEILLNAVLLFTKGTAFAVCDPNAIDPDFDFYYLRGGGSNGEGATVFQGQTVTITHGVRNCGPGPQFGEPGAAYTLELYIQTPAGALVTTLPIVYGAQLIEGMGDIKSSFLNTSSLTTGNYTLLGIVYTGVQDTNEANNSRQINISIVEGCILNSPSATGDTSVFYKSEEGTCNPPSSGGTPAITGTVYTEIPTPQGLTVAGTSQTTVDLDWQSVVSFSYNVGLQTNKFDFVEYRIQWWPTANIPAHQEKTMKQSQIQITGLQPNT